MRVVKVLENKNVIRTFGLFLLVSPFINVLISIYFQKASPTKWTLGHMWQEVQNGGTITNLLTVCSIALGLVMLSGSTKAWKFALALLGGFIIVQLFRLDRDMQNHWIAGVAFLINVLAFAFIADQIVFKQKFDNLPSQFPKDAPLPKPTEVIPPPSEIPFMPIESLIQPPKQSEVLPNIIPIAKVRRETTTSAIKILFAFENETPWAQLLSISTEGVEVLAITAPPPGIEKRVIEIQLANLPFQMQLKTNVKGTIFFEFQALDSNKIIALNSWLKLKSQAA
jgi:hypothetical protein